jgi:hypothetical protein
MYMEQMGLYFNLVLILAFVAGNAFFVGSEIAISSARRSRIKQLAEEGDRRAARVEMLHNEPEALLLGNPGRHHAGLTGSWCRRYGDDQQSDRFDLCCDVFDVRQ